MFKLKRRVKREFESSMVLTWFISFESCPAIKNKTFSQIIPASPFPQKSRPIKLRNFDFGRNSPLPRRLNSTYKRIRRSSNN